MLIVRSAHLHTSTTLTPNSETYGNGDTFYRATDQQRFRNLTVMIKYIEFDQKETLRPGDERIFRAWATTPLFMRIECFRQPPSPPQLRTCQECGEFPLGNGEPCPIRVSSKVFKNEDG